MLKISLAFVQNTLFPAFLFLLSFLIFLLWVSCSIQRKYKNELFLQRKYEWQYLKRYDSCKYPGMANGRQQHFPKIILPMNIM